MISHYINKITSRVEYLYWKTRGQIQIEINGYRVDMPVSDYLGDFREIKFFQENETGEMSDILQEATSDDTFLDIGANIGIHSIFADKIVDTVYAIEPHPVNISHLIVNNSRNNGDVNIFSIAMSNSDGYIQISGPRGGLLADGSVAFSDFDLPSKPGPSDGRENKLSVYMEKGDELVESGKIEVPNIIKIDVEGAEEQVIAGLSTTLDRTNCRLVYCEVHEDRADFKKIVSKLESSGFNVDVIDERDYSRTIKASK